mmetsp:Transcript_71560/g.113906  ORF Transcript_71560/g.113906 Transcript_71560/m.113906 type:complete len:220 (-) Transcript_71560:716-1375(-)
MDQTLWCTDTNHRHRPCLRSRPRLQMHCLLALQNMHHHLVDRLRFHHHYCLRLHHCPRPHHRLQLHHHHSPRLHCLRLHHHHLGVLLSLPRCHLLLLQAPILRLLARLAHSVRFSSPSWLHQLLRIEFDRYCLHRLNQMVAMSMYPLGILTDLFHRTRHRSPLHNRYIYRLYGKLQVDTSSDIRSLFRVYQCPQHIRSPRQILVQYAPLLSPPSVSTIP